MSDGISDAHRESRFKPKPLSSSITQNTHMPERCNNCIFITRNPHDNQWECTNPLQSQEACHEDGNCMFHLTCEELAVYFRQRLKDKLTGESKVSDKSTLRCKHILDDDCGNCSKIDGFECPFVGMWDTATKLCKGYEFTPRKFNVVDTAGDHITPISGPFDSEEEANKYIAKYIKVREIK